MPSKTSALPAPSLTTPVGTTPPTPPPFILGSAKGGSTPPSDRGGGPTYIARWRQNQQAGYDSEQWAMLELELGRFGLGASLVCGFILVFTAYVASLFVGNPNLANLVAAFRRPEMVLWLPLLATSFLVAGFTVAKKIGPYRRGYRSAHFVSSVAAFGFSILFLFLSLMDHIGLFLLDSLIPLMWPASVAGMSLALASLALTWEGVGIRRLASMGCAAWVPISLALIPILQIPFDDSRLTLLYALDAMIVVFAGAMLLLIASGVEAGQREILKASDTRFAQLREEVESKIQALAYREKAYVEQEAHIEAREKHLHEMEAELNTRNQEISGAQAKIDTHGKVVIGQESQVAKLRAETEAKVQELGLKDREINAVRSQLDASQQSVAEREQALGDREKEVKRLQIEVASRERALAATDTVLKNLETRLRTEGQAIDGRRQEVIRLEKELALKASEIRMKAEALEGHQSKDVKEKVKELRDWEAKVLAKEREIADREAALQTLTEDLKHRRADADSYANALQGERDRLAGREKELNAVEKRISDASSEVDERIAETERQWEEAREMKKRLDTREGEYNELFKEAKLREASFESAREDLTRRLSALEAQDTKFKEWQTNLGLETKKLQDRHREVLANEKRLQAKENELSLKELEVRTREREAERAAPAPGMLEADAAKVWDLREAAFQERAEETKRNMYSKEKELEAREMALRQQRLDTAPTSGDEEVPPPPSEARAGPEDRLKTGTARLDDLLYGGLPPNANLLFVGPAFVGKEVAILNFIAEGLRASIPAVLVTTSKAPVEISKDIAPVLPTFMEYENLGLVRWIDASGTTPTKKLTREGNTFRVQNSADFEGILKAVDATETEFRDKGAPYFRLAFLTLSSSLTHSEEKAAIGFIQRFVNRLRQGRCLAAFALERGMHTDQQVETLQQLMDGAIHFKQEKSKTMLCVVGIGEVQTRDWVPYKFTNKSIMVGSFQLERIR